MLLVVVVLAVGLAADREAHADGLLEVVDISHHPDGRLDVALRLADPDAVVTDLRATVDGVPYPITVARETAAPVSVVVAIDTSGSMEGEPLLAARQAAAGLVQRLGVDDRVAVVAFADVPLVMSTFEGGAFGASSGIENLWAAGNTALYAAIDESLVLLEGEGGRTRAIVLLSDGQDTLAGLDASEDERRHAEVVQAITASGVQMHAFAFGADADEEFLREVAEAGGGGFWSVTDGAALEELFAHLGARLGATTEATVDVPVLARGDHAVTVRAVVDGAPVAAEGVVAVSNARTVEVAVRPSAADGGPVVLDLRTALPADGLRFAASAGGHPLEVIGHPPRVLIDPWEFAPGVVDVRVTAHLDAAVVTEMSAAVRIPPLQPELSLRVEAADGVAVLEGRAQGAPDAELVVRSAGAEVARGPVPALTFDMPPGAERLELAIESGGRVLHSTGFEAPPAAPTFWSATPWWGEGSNQAAVAATALAAGIMLLWRRRARSGAPRSRRATRALRGRPAAPVLGGAGPLGLVAVQSPDGETREYELRRRPLSVGSASSCDVAIHDEGVAALHARVYALGGGEFRVHGIAPRGVPGRSPRNDEWMVVRDGEQIVIGRHLLTVRAYPDAAPGGIWARDGVA